MPETKKQFDFKLGADPEFVLTMQGRKVDAKQTMELMLNKKPGFKSNPQRDGFDVIPFGNIGWDGSASTAEIRPKASHDPKEITSNLEGMFKAFIQHIKICDMSTISEYSSVGGHIHLEIPKGEKWTNEKKNKIHRAISSFYLPVLIAENKTNLNLRLKQNYGSIKDYRIEEKFKYEDGSPGYTFEFRCPSAEWLTTPKITEATLAYFGVIYHEILKHPKNFAKFTDIIYKSDKQGDALQTLAIMEFNLLTQNILNKAKKYVRTFEMYEQYKNEIEYIFNPKQVIKDKQKANYNIAIGWTLIGKTLPKKSEILSSKKKIQKIAEKRDFDMLKGVMNIHYNDDKNVALFAENLKDRVAAFNWKLKNNYYLFGMRKGIESIIAKNLKDEYVIGKETIKTLLDKDELNKLFHKMNQKFNSSSGIGTRNATLDFITGKVKDIRENVILIGIPYDIRIKENQKVFLNSIWSLEKGDLPKKIHQKEEGFESILINDINLPVEQRGEIYKILTKQNEAPQEIVLDEGSQSLRNSERAVENAIYECVHNQETN